MKTKNKTVEYDVQDYSNLWKGWCRLYATFKTLNAAKNYVDVTREEYPDIKLRIVKVTKEVVK